MQHLAELRSCLIRCFFALLAGAILSLSFSKEIFHILQKPLLAVMPTNSTFVATSPLEAWTTYLKVGMLAGFLVSSPFIFYQIFRFVAPGLMRNEKKWSLIFVSLASVFFIGGALFGYFFIFPIGFKFFVAALSGTEIVFLPQMKDYLTFISRMLLLFGLVFEMPLVIVLLTLMGIVGYKTLSHFRRYNIVIMFFAAALLTPGPDVISQLLLALPLLALYEISLLAVWLLERRRLKQMP